MTALMCARVEELAPGFVLGALELDEMAAVREHLEGCPRPHLELTELGEVMPALAVAPEPLEPPAWLRESVIAAAQADLEAHGRIVRPFAAVAEPEAAEPEPEAEPTAPLIRIVALPPVHDSRRRVAAAWLARVAAAAVVVGLAGYAFVAQSDLNKAKEEQEQAAKIVNVIGEPGSRSVTLTDVQATGAGGTVVLQQTGHVMVYLNHLPQTSGDQIYSVWITSADGVVLKVGSLYPRDDGTGFLEVDNVPTSATLWVQVNLEPNRNVTAPTGQPILTGALSL